MSSLSPAPEKSANLRSRKVHGPNRQLRGGLIAYLTLSLRAVSCRICAVCLLTLGIFLSSGSTILTGGIHAETAAPLPPVPELMRQVQEHQRQLDRVRENYTFHETMQVDDLDDSGRVKKSETSVFEVFYVNSHEIRRLVRDKGKDLSESEQKKEQERVNKEVAKAEKTPPGTSADENQVSIAKLLAIMKVSAPRRLVYGGRPSIAFDFVGDPHAHTHGMAEDASKKLAGTLWIDEKDLQVVHLEVHFDDNFRIGGGLLATVEKGSSFTFDQAIVNGELWLPSAGTASLRARALLFKGIRQRVTLHDGDYQRFHTETIQQPGVTVHPQ